MTSPQRFSYRAVRPDGATEVGELRAADRSEVVRELSGAGLFPVAIDAMRSPTLARSTLPLADVATGFEVLAEFLEAGLTLRQSLRALDGIAPSSWTPWLPVMRDSIRRGEPFSTALAQCSVSWGSTVLGLIQAGDAGGDMAAAVRRASVYLTRRNEVARGVRDALTYPAILLAVGTGSLVLLVGTVLPRFATIVSDLGQQLPRSTAVLLDLSALAMQGALPSAVLLVAGVIAARLVIARPAGRKRWDLLLWHLPVIGSHRRRTGTARIAESLGALLVSGVPLARALDQVGGTSGDTVLDTRITDARQLILEGARVSDALASLQVVTPAAVRLIRAGEDTGRLAEMLHHAARLEADQAVRTVRRMVRLLEPTLILGFGVLVAVVAAAMLQAMYGVRVR